MYKYTTNKILSTNRPYSPNYPEHKPIKEKLLEMEENPEEYINAYLCRFKKQKKLELSLKQKHIQFNSRDKKASWFDTIYWFMDFDVTENYIWHIAAKNAQNLELNQFMMDAIMDINARGE